MRNTTYGIHGEERRRFAGDFGDMLIYLPETRADMLQVQRAIRQAPNDPDGCWMRRELSEIRARWRAILAIGPGPILPA